MAPPSSESAFPGPRGTLQAAAALLARAGIRAGKLTVKEEQGHFLLQTVVISTGRQRVALRVVHPQKVAWLKREAFVLRHLQGSGMVPVLLAETLGTEALPQPHHLIKLPTGKQASNPLSNDDAAAIGALLGAFHSEADVGLRFRAPTLGRVSLMAAFQSLSDDVRAYLSRRERDGLPQDLLTLSLSDLMRGLRRYVVAQDHHFLPPPPHVLCHGSMNLNRALRTTDNRWMLTGFELSHAGDGAQDLAHLVERTEMDDARTLKLLEGYREARGRNDGLLVPRICAWRVLFRLQRAVSGLRELQDLTDVLDEGLSGRTDALEWFGGMARENMRLALNGLMDFTGPARPMSIREVEAMGALIAVEELHLRGTCPVVGIEGPPYTGKTPLAQELAARVRVPWIGLAAVLRGAAWAAQRKGPLGPETLARSIRDLQIHLVEGRLRLLSDNQDVLAAVTVSSLDVHVDRALAGHALVRAALRELVTRACVRGAIVEGAELQGLLPVQARVFQLWASPAVRVARRDAHLQSTPPPARVPPAPPPDDPMPQARAGAVLLDASNLSLPQLVRSVLRTLVPGVAGHESSLTGRSVLYS